MESVFSHHLINHRNLCLFTVSNLSQKCFIVFSVGMQVTLRIRNYHAEHSTRLKNPVALTQYMLDFFWITKMLKDVLSEDILNTPCSKWPFASEIAHQIVLRRP